MHCNWGVPRPISRQGNHKMWCKPCLIPLQCLKLMVSQLSLVTKNWAGLPWAGKNYNRLYKERNFLNISGRLRENYSLKHCNWQSYTGLILGLRPANERCRYKVKLSLTRHWGSNLESALIQPPSSDCEAVYHVLASVEGEFQFEHPGPFDCQRSDIKCKCMFIFKALWSIKQNLGCIYSVAIWHHELDKQRFQALIH